MDVIRLITVTGRPLSVDTARQAVADPAAGGIAIFAGAVREDDHGRPVTRLSYSAHPSAGAELRTVAEKVAADFPVCGVAVAHRTGDLAIGDLAVVCAVSCPHRAQALAACQMLIDEVKRCVPVWKHQFYRDGSDEWVNCA